MMNRWMNTFLMTVAVSLLGSTQAIAQPRTETAKVEQLAKAAVSPSDHTEVAKLFHARAAELVQKAEKHEKTARSMQSNQPAINYKWPAMSQRPWEKELQLAMQARRASEESTQLAQRHLNLAEKASKPADVE